MSRRTDTIPPDWFDALYARDGDPWKFATSAYEAEKYAATLAALPAPRYGRALEVGCAIGVFTARLAGRCDALVAVDASAVALAEAGKRCAGLANVELRRAVLPKDFPDGSFDLIVLSEVLYYLALPDLDQLASRCFAAQADGPAHLILCHWLGDTDYPLTGTDASRAFVTAASGAGYRHELLVADTYRLDRLVRPGA